MVEKCVCATEVSTERARRFREVSHDALAQHKRMADQDPALAEQRAAQRAARLAQLRRMSSLEYVGKTALDATVAAVFLTPPFFIVNTLSSFLGQKAK